MDYSDERVRTYTAHDLNPMPCIEEGASCDLKVDTGDFRVWIDRVYEDVEYETYQDGQWWPAHYQGGAFLPVIL